MRTQSITGLSPDEELLARPVDPTGWLTRPTATDVGSDGVGILAGPDGRGNDVAIGERVSRRAEDESAARTGGRAGRRASRVRRRRRVSTQRLARQVPASRNAIDSMSMGSAPVGAVSVGAASIRTAAAESVVEGYRLGRWARFALTVTVLATVIVVIATLTAGSTTATMVDVTVGPGDSLWSIASAAAPDRDPRAVIDDMRQLNDLAGDVLPVGMVLRVPTSGDTTDG
jgi:LysM domain